MCIDELLRENVTCMLKHPEMESNTDRSPRWDRKRKVRFFSNTLILTLATVTIFTVLPFFPLEVKQGVRKLGKIRLQAHLVPQITFPAWHRHGQKIAFFFKTSLFYACFGNVTVIGAQKPWRSAIITALHCIDGVPGLLSFVYNDPDTKFMTMKIKQITLHHKPLQWNQTLLCIVLSIYKWLLVILIHDMLL